MTISLTLSPDQQARIAAAVARGEFRSEEEAARAAFGLGILQLDCDEVEETEAEVARINALLDESEAAVARGEFVSASECKTFMAAQLASIRR